MFQFNFKELERTSPLFDSIYPKFSIYKQRRYLLSTIFNPQIIQYILKTNGFYL